MRLRSPGFRANREPTRFLNPRTKFPAGASTMLFNKDRPGMPERERNGMKRHIRNRVIGLAAGTVAFGAISACGGGGSGGGLDVADGGIRGTGSSVGPVSGFGSVFVNGVEFSTDRTVVGDDGINQESRLVVGMILRVDGEWRETGLGDADTVEYDDTLRGTMQVLTPWEPVSKTATIQMLGQAVRIDSQTVVKGMTVETLADDDFVRMSGW